MLQIVLYTVVQIMKSESCDEILFQIWVTCDIMDQKSDTMVLNSDNTCNLHEIISKSHSAIVVFAASLVARSCCLVPACKCNASCNIMAKQCLGSNRHTRQSSAGKKASKGYQIEFWYNTTSQSRTRWLCSKRRFWTNTVNITLYVDHTKHIPKSCLLMQ